MLHLSRRMAIATLALFLSSGNVSAEPVSIDLPEQPLADSLTQLARVAGITLFVDSSLVEGKSGTAIKGRYEPEEIIRSLLFGTGLRVTKTAEGTFTITRIPGNNANIDELQAVTVQARQFSRFGPMPGLNLSLNQIPGNMQTLSADDIKRAHALSLSDLMNSTLQSVNVNDYQGNPFQMDVQYRGFTAGPQIGTPQGLSVFLDGVRVNEPFGDVVNWDLIRMNALAGIDIFPGSNPLFGLGTLGGALSMNTKNGFEFDRLETEVLTGSYGRRQFQVSNGWSSDRLALFGAGKFFLEDGWRTNSPSKVNQAFADLSYRGDKLDLSLKALVVHTNLVGNGLVPSEMYAQDRDAIFTAPDTTKNRLHQFQLSGAYQLSENASFTAQVYRRDSKRDALGADVYTEFENTPVRRNLLPGE